MRAVSHWRHRLQCTRAGFVTLVDRKKDMILSGGFNVFRATSRRQSANTLAVAEVTVSGIPDEYRGQSAKAFIAFKPAFGIDELKAFLADKLAKEARCRPRWKFAPACPKRSVGKLSKKELLAEEIAKRQATVTPTVNRPEAA